MKKILSILFAVTVLFASCSKEARINRQLDGDWTLTKENGVAVPSTDAITYSFKKDKKGGTVTMTSTGAFAFSFGGTYEISDDKITFTFLGSSVTSTITEHSKKTFKFKDSSGDESELTKK